MSGIAGIVNLDGAPIDLNLLSRLTNSLSFRGPDARQIQIENHVGLGHTLLRINGETYTQISTLDGKVWLTADARIDARYELTKNLRLTSPANDAELILHAYEAWGEDCVKHLIGDFAFIIWDSRRQTLFCARDHLGVRQLYYSHNHRSFVVSNTLNCLRQHPHVSNELNEIAIGDFLLFGLNQELNTTTFADIQKLPRAHTLTLTDGKLRIQQYWTPSVNTTHERNRKDVIDEFLDLLRQTVADRVGKSGAGISMSGGLDSSAVAAMAAETSADLTAYCVVYDQVFTDDERKYATLVADALKIPIEFLPGAEINEQTNSRTTGIAPEPFDVDPIFVVSDELVKRIAGKYRVALTGWDGDTLMEETPKHSFAAALKRGAIVELFAELARYVYFTRSLPPVGMRTRWRHWKNPHWNRSPYPSWLNQDFASRLNLAERWQHAHAEHAPAHPTRPRVFRAFDAPSWDSLFTRFDAAVTLLPLEVRHPLIDVRMVDYLLALPIIPWLLDKTIVREAMDGFLPDIVRLRPKTPLQGDPGLQLRHSTKFQEVDGFRPVPEILSYVDRKSIPKVTEEVDSNQLWLNLRPFSLNQWLTYSHSMEHTNDI